MTSKATRLLAEAKRDIGRGEAFYRKAAEAIAAAMDADPTLGYGRISESVGKSAQWCRDIVRWHTNPQSTGRGNAVSPYAEESGAVAQRHAKSVLRKAEPEEIAEQLLSDPAIRAKVSKAQDIAHREVEQKSRDAQRQAIGEHESDKLDEQQRFHDAEAELFKARRALIETLRHLNAIGAEGLPDSWREEFLRTFDDIVAKAELGRALLVGSLDEELEKLLEA